MKYCLGLKPARPESVKLRLSNYLDHRSLLPKVPVNYGHANLIQSWGMLGNGPDDNPSDVPVGDCAIAGPEHVIMAWAAASGHSVPPFDYASTINMYSEITGYDPSQYNPSTGDNPTDGGSDMTTVAEYWQSTGFTDSSGATHKIGAFLALEPGDLQQLGVAAYLFEAVGLGLDLPASAEDQFDRMQPWTVTDASIVGGHYVPVIGRQNSNYQLVSWGGLASMTPGFVQNYTTMAIVYLSPEMLNAQGKSAEGLDINALKADLAALDQL